MKSILLYVLVWFCISACGSSNECGEEDQWGNKNDECGADLSGLDNEREISGSVSGVFEVTVNDEVYSDIEDFYSEELAALPKKIEKMGYVGYDVKLDAEIGFADLGHSMIVFLVPADDRGYSSSMYLKMDRTFSFTVPKDQASDVYRIKAIKRIAIDLDNGTETLRFCYNFAAVENEVSYGEEDKPIVLNSFETSITAYDCQKAEKETGLKIPPASKADVIE